MIFTPTEIEGAFIVELERHADERGSFARSFCREEFEAHGLNSQVAQCNISVNSHRGTLRGMHSQAPGYEEAKLGKLCTGRPEGAGGRQMGQGWGSCAGASWAGLESFRSDPAITGRTSPAVAAAGAGPHRGSPVRTSSGRGPGPSRSPGTASSGSPRAA